MKKNFEGADGIRGLACLIVLVLHTVGMNFHGFSGYFIGLAKFGVWIFFVLSAFLLTKKLTSDGFSFEGILAYSFGRVFRILPIFYLFVVFYLVAGTVNINNASDAADAMMMVRGFAHMWTIPVEFKFYAILPLVAWGVFHSYKRFGVIGALVSGVACVALEQAVWPYWETPKDTIEVVWYLSCFTIGIVGAVTSDHVVGRVSARLEDFTVVVSILGVVLVSPAFRSVVFGIPPTDYLLNKFLYFALVSYVLIMAALNGKGWFSRFCRSYPMKCIGKWSFSIYLAHWYVVVTITDLYSSSWMAVALIMAVSISVGWAVNSYIERPIESTRHKLTGYVAGLGTRLSKDSV